MIVDRRTAIRIFLLIAGGTALLPACLRKEGAASISLKHLKIKASEEKLLAEISETLIPKTGIPGAKEMKAHLFVLKMVDDCATKEEQQDFMNGMDTFNDLCKKNYNQSFIACTPAQREELLNRLDKKAFTGKVASFYTTVKSLTIDAFLTSQLVMTKILPYELVPGRWHGCVPAKKPTTKLI